MVAAGSGAWRCTVCGYIHRGSEPPEWCPVCGAAREEFEPYVDEAVVVARPATARWRCLVCHYVHEEVEPPASCPVCGTPKDRFEALGVAPARYVETAGAVRVVVVGGGIAGVAAAEAARAASPGAEVTLISKERELPYYRLNLTRFLAGEIGEEALPIYPENWYREQRVHFRLDTEVSTIDLEGRTVSLYAGEKVPFEKLVLTAGAHPFVPPFPGAYREGVTTLRTLDDARRILALASPGAKCVCIGGGILGLETAGALARRGVEVTLLEGYGWLLPRQLNQRAGGILQQYVADVGIQLRMRARTGELVGDERVRGVLLEDKSLLPADLVVIATGIRPNSYLARLAGLEVNQGVIVDDYLASSHPDVYAAGDVAEHRGTIYGIWMPAKSQGAIAGLNAVGGRVEFGGIPRSNTLKVLGLDLFSIGKVEPEDGSYEVIDQHTGGQYFRFLFRDSHLVGAILLGDTTLTAVVKRAVESRIDFSALLQWRPSAAEVGQHLAELVAK